MTAYRKVRAAGAAFGFVLAASATAGAQSIDIPLQLMQSSEGVRLIVNVGIGGQTPRPYLFDTGSDTFNAFYSASAFGTVPLSMQGLPTGVNYNYGDNGLTSNIFVGDLVATPSLTFYPAGSTSGGVKLNATTANGVPSNYLISAVTSHVLENSKGVVTHTYDISQPVEGAGTFAGYYGVFGAGNFTTQRDGVTVGGVLGQTAIAGTTTGYVVAANGTPLNSLGTVGSAVVPGASANGPQVGQSVTSCSPCVMLGLTPALLAQFSSIDTLKSVSQGKPFSNTNAPSGAEFGINMAVTLAQPGQRASTFNQPTLLDTGTGNIEIYNPTIKSPGTAPLGSVVTMAAPNAGADVTVDSVYPQGSNSNPNSAPPYEVLTSNSKTDTYLGIGFFLQNSVLYNLAGTLVGYTPNFVTDVDIATAAGAPLVVGSGSVPLGLAGVISGPGGLSIASMGSATLSGANTYTGLTTISGGSLFLVGPGSIAASSGVDVSASGRFDISGIASGASIASLSGDASGIVNLGGQTLTLYAANGSFAGTIAGAGGLTLAGGTEILSGASNYSGPTTINGGVLEVDGSVAATSGVTVNAGGALSGVGFVDPITTLLASGATLAPGNRANPLGTLTIGGNLAMASGSIYQIAVTPSAASRTSVTGTATLSGGTVEVEAQPGAYAAKTRYAILTATGGVTGAFAGIVTNYAFLTPSLSYDGTDAFLTLKASPTFCAAGMTANQCAVGNALTAAPTGPGFNTMLAQTPGGAIEAANALSGEIHASAISAAFEDASLPRQAVLDRLASPYGDLVPGDAGGFSAFHALEAPDFAPKTFAAWGQAFGAYGHIGGDGNASTLNSSLGGFILGADGNFDSRYRFGVAGGFTRSFLSVDSLASSGEIQSTFGGVYGGASLNALQLSGGALYAFDRFSTNRAIAYPGLAQTASAAYDGDALQAFGEAGWRFGAANFIEPFLGAMAMQINTASFSETGGNPSLDGASGRNDFAATTLGVRAQASLFADAPLTARVMTGWRHIFGDTTPAATLAFEGAPSAPFTISGAPIDRDACIVEAGFDWKLTSSATVGVFYSGAIAAHEQVNALKGEFVVAF